MSHTSHNASFTPQTQQQPQPPPHQRPSPHSTDFVPNPQRRPSVSTTTVTDIYANASLRENARAQLAILLSHPHPALNLPDVVGAYYAILPLDRAPTPLFGVSGPLAMMYKGVSVVRGLPSALLRIVGVPPSPSAQIVRAGDAWKRVRHPTILCLKEVFTTRQFTTIANQVAPPLNEVIFAYEYATRADTLYNVFLNPSSTSPSTPSNPATSASSPTTEHHRFHPLSEVTLWAIATQLLSAVAIVHSNRLALRDALVPMRILVVGRNRIKISCVGLNDALDPGGCDHIVPYNVAAAAAAAAAANRNNSTANTVTNDSVLAFQKQDLASIGHILAALALRIDQKIVRSGVLHCSEDVAVDALRRLTPYTDDLTVLIMSLLSAAMPASQVTTNQILGMIGPRLALELGNVWSHCDSLEAKLFTEFDSSRMYRLTTLLGFVNERTDAGVEPQWSETGDRYLLKLFRDYVFHQVDDDGNAVLDMAHVTECLARLDVGSPEQILLCSRDGASLLVASYEELRRCLMQSIDELRGIRIPTR